MNQHHTTIRDLTGNPALESIELSDVRRSTGFADESPVNVQDADGFDHLNDEMSERDADAAFVAEMERRDRETVVARGIMAARFAAYRDDDLVLAVDLIDRGEVDGMGAADRLRLLDAATAEVLRRLGGSDGPAPTDDAAEIAPAVREAVQYVTRRVPAGATVHVSQHIAYSRCPGLRGDRPGFLETWRVSITHVVSGRTCRGMYSGDTGRQTADAALKRFNVALAKHQPARQPRRARVAA